jgi:hypothetical protein
MKFPVAVRASDGKKYFSPDAGPATFQRRGSWACQTTITTPKATATAATRRPTSQRIRFPARRWSTNNQAATSGVTTCAQYATDRTAGSRTTITPSRRMSTIPLASRTSATPKRP